MQYNSNITLANVVQ